MFAHIFKKFDDSQPRDKDGKWTSISFGGKDKGWVGVDGPLSAADAKRANSLRLPPGVKNMRLSKDPKAALQAQWEDKKGKVQPRYSAAHSEKQAAEKWERVRDFHKTAVKQIMERAQRDMLNPQLSQKQRDTAATVHLIAKTGFRVGSSRDTGAEAQAYGASTLTPGHVKIKGDDISFAFVGKKGVAITKTITDSHLAKYMKGKMSGMKKTEKIFSSSDSAVLGFIKDASGNSSFKTKDFRTWHGTGVALKLRNQMGAPKNEKEAAAFKKEIATKVAAHLGNTPAVAIKDYIAPFVWAPWDGGKEISKKADSGTESPDDYTQFEELWDIMEEAVANIEYDEVPTDWRTIPELDNDPDDEEVTKSDVVFKGFAYVFNRV
jgi:DNA topoisomerase-1